MAVDMELRKAFAELQRKMVETQAQVSVADAQIKSLGVEERKNMLTTSQIEALPDDVKLYESIGRMFMLQPKPAVIKHLKEEKEATKTKASDLEAKKNYLLRSLKSSEENLREMVSQRRK